VDPVHARSVTQPNLAQIEYWNEQSGPKWVTRQVELDRFLSSLGEQAMDRLEPLAGTRVLDVGCGCGATTLALAERTGPRGSVLGNDVSAPMLARARERSRGVPGVAYLEADAQTHRFDSGSVDAIFSRFGVMFFADPPAAFANLRTALRAHGALAFICWQELRKNPWCLVPLMAVAHHVELPPPPAPGEPGPFALGDPVRVRSILEGAGWTHIQIDALEQPLGLADGGGIEEAVEFALEVGPAARVVKDVAPDVKARVRDAVRDALLPFAGPGGVRLPSACWIVTARHAA
jgi:SAM-dependent methyltransferase